MNRWAIFDRPLCGLSVEKGNAPILGGVLWTSCVNQLTHGHLLVHQSGVHGRASRTEMDVSPRSFRNEVGTFD